MTGKVPSSRSRRDKSRNSRPYDRANQSIFGKVASTVKDLFTPSWLLSVSGWAGANSEETDAQVSPEDAAEADLTENEDEPEMQLTRPRQTGRHKRPRLESQDITSTTDIPFWLGPSTSHDNLSHETEKNECDSIRKEAPNIVNGDDHSENSDGSASTSGCSSLVSSHDKPHRSGSFKLDDCALETIQTELKSKPVFQNQRKEVATLTSDVLETSHNVSCGSGTLWSCRTQSSLKSPQFPTLLNSSRPSFNVSSFGTPSKGNTIGNKVSSPFYEGSTAFGGASAYRRRRTLANTPYALNPTKSARPDVKIKDPSKSGISSAARRILQTLETMSTPISDAKKIPNVSRSPMDIPLTISPPSHRMKLVLSTSRNSPVLRPKGPPAVNLDTISKANVLKNHRSKTRNSMMELPLREQPMTSLPEQCSVSRPQDTSDTVQRTNNSSGGGKMKTKLRESLHASSKAKTMEETTPEYQLPNIPLPITSNLPVFKLHTNKVDKSMLCIAEKNKVSEQTSSKPSSTLGSSNEPAFTFASPIDHVPPKNSFQTQKMPAESSFKFSSPLNVPRTSSSILGENKDKKDEIYSNRSVNDIWKQLSEESENEKEKTTDSSTSTPKTSSSAVSGVNINVQKQPGSLAWQCKNCSSWIAKTSLKCTLCTNPKRDNTFSSSSSVKNNLGFGDRFKPPEGTWECTSCMLRNNSNKEKCIACEAPRNPSSNKVATGVSLEKDQKKETPANTTSSTKLFQNTAGTWECDSCMVRTPDDKDKCVACGTLRASRAKAGSFDSAPFKFAANSSSGAEPSGFKFSSLVSTSAATFTTTTFKFGCSTESAKSASPASASNITFGASTVSPASIFGDSAKKNNDSTSEANANPKLQETFKFGLPTFPAASSESSIQSSSQPALSGNQSDSQVSKPVAPPITTSTTAVEGSGGGFTFAKLGDKPATATTNAQFSAEFFKKPADSSTNMSSGFVFPVTSLGTSATSTVNFGTSTLPKTMPAIPETFAPETSKPLNFSAASTTPSFNVGTAVTSQSDAFHSKTLPQVTAKPAESKTEATVQPVISTFSNSAPMFTFGAVTSSPATSVVTTTSTSSVFGGFGNPSQAGQKQLKGMSTQVKNTVSSLVPQPIPSVTPSTASSPFPFQTSSVFPSIPAAGVLTDNKTATSQNQTQRTQANPAPFSFGLAPTTTSVFSFGSNNTAVSSSGFTCTTTVAASSQITKTVDTAQTSQKSCNLFAFAASKPSTEPTQPTSLAFKGVEDDTKVMFPQPSQPQFGSFKSQPATDSAAGSVFRFGSTAPPSSNTFVFGATSKSDSTTMPAAPAPFTFGSAAPKPSSFGGFQPSQQQPVTSSMPAFNFGGSMSVASTASAFNPAGSAPFTFTAKSNQPQPAAPATVAFGSSSVQPVFGGTAPTPGFGSTAAPSFGSTATPTFGSVSASKPESSGGFNFNPQQQPQQQPGNPFQFGAPAEKKSQPAPAQGAGFGFGMTPQVDGNPSFSANFNMVSPSNFNFGGAVSSTPTNQPFLFAANSEVSSTPASAAPRRIRRAVRRGIRKPD